MQVCTYSEFSFTSVSDAFKALKNMGLGTKVFGGPEGLELVKPMGTGSGNGFSIVPNFRRFAFVSIWRSQKNADDFFNADKLPLWYQANASSSLHVTLKPLKVHGVWGGRQPFRMQPEVVNSGPIAVLTRATIKKRFLPEFWLHVPEVSGFMAGASGVLHQLGVGEYPLFMQATFSIWINREALSNAAYRNTVHADIVKKTRQRGWYAEEMFAQFKVLSIRTKGSDLAHMANICTV